METLPPVLFLDVDGVLNTEKGTTPMGLSKPCLRRLREIVQKTQCDIVLSSTWRKLDYAKAELKKQFQYKGIPLWVSETPCFNSGYRGEEIREWLRHNPQVNTYAILDDDSDMLPEQLPNFFQTDPEFGLSKNIAYRVTYHLLNGKYGHRVNSYL